MNIQGTQIELRDWALTDLKAYCHWNREGHEWQELDGPYFPRMTESELKEKVQHMEGTIEENNFPTPRTSLAIADLETHRLIGQVSWYWQGKETDWVSIGIVIYDPKDWGKGIGFEALGIWMDYLFQSIPAIVRLDLRTWSGNEGMMRLAEKLGFLLEARFRKARIVKGEYYDGLGYGILREEWRAHP